ncbi:MAG: DUF885 domain-containing protein [Hyphomonadaceae bacterium]
MKLASISLAALMLAVGCSADRAGAPQSGDTANSQSASQNASADQEAETARLNAFFEAAFNESVARSPMQQTFLGIKTDYDKWDDASDENALAEMNIQRAHVAEMREKFDPANLDAQGALSFRLAEYQLEQAERNFKYRSNAYLFNQMRGQHAGIPAFMINQHRISDVSDAEAYISRLNGVGAFLGTFIDQSQASAANGVLAPKFVYDYVLESAGNVIQGYPFEGSPPESPSPLYEDFAKKVAALDIDDDAKDDLLFRSREALIDSVSPAYVRLIETITEQRDAAGTDDGVWRLPDGANYYAARLANMTTTDMTATQIHDLGLAEMDRIHGEMEVIKDQVGFEGSLQDFFVFMRNDSQFYKPDTDEGRAEYLAEATALIDTMRDNLPRMFNRFPEAGLVVKAVEPFREKAAGKAFYQRPAPDGSRPGTYYANLYQMTSMPTYQMEALAYHEGIPGHHMQIAISQELEGLPKFRKFGGYTAYSEGWGLYTEFLPKELGFYEDPYSDFGRLSMELWRAARLVVDTGLHDKRWTREQATQYLIDNTPNAEWDCIKAIDRYIVMPGQATAYKIGMLKILELRERAKTALGDAFTLADFHDVVLSDGPIPLAVLEEKTDAWIAASTH